MITGEFDFIRKIQAKLGRSARVLVGVGDDAAVVVPPQGDLLVTVDCLVEGVHFDLSYTDAVSLGHKALAVNLSDIAAMGGRPLYAVVSLGIREGLEESFLLEMYDGLLALARQHGVDVIGGNCTKSPTFFIDITLMGEAGDARPLRSSGEAGDLLAVTGFPGDSAAGLAALQRFGKSVYQTYPQLVSRHLKPEPRVEFGQRLGEERIAHALIDVSDGLASELHHLSQASKLAVEVHKNLIPVSPEATKLGDAVSIDALDWSLFGGEAYELLFSFKEKDLMKVSALGEALGCPVTVVGSFKGGRGVWLLNDGKKAELPAKGWDHFAEPSGKSQR